jgi:hypothetical protein
MIAFYIHVPSSDGGTAEVTETIEKVDLRAHATEFVYGEAAYIQGLAQKEWPEIDWRVESVRTARYIVRGKPKSRKSGK